VYQQILVAFDDTPEGMRAFTTALELAKGHATRIHLLSVIEGLAQTAGETIGEVEDAFAHAQKHLEWIQQPALERARREGIEAVSYIVPRRLSEAVIDLADSHKIDLIVLGSLGRSRMLGLFVEQGYEIAKHAKCSVLIAR